MILNIRIDDQLQSLEVPDEIIAQASDFFNKMDGNTD